MTIILKRSISRTGSQYLRVYSDTNGSLNRQINNEILFIECKWSDLRLKEAESVLRELMGKSGFVDWNNGKRKEYFGIVARKIEGKDQLKKRGFFCL